MHPMEDDSRFLYHTACHNCGSSDAGAVYSDGHFYCFSCGHYEPPPSTNKANKGGGKVLPDYEPVVAPKEVKFIEIGFTAIPKRGLTKETCEMYNYGVGIYNNQKVQVANYYDKSTLIGQHVRTKDKEFFWIGKSNGIELFGQSIVSNKANTLVITEGEIDCLSIAQSVKSPYIGVVSLPNGAKSAAKAIANNLKFVERFEKVILWFDQDEPGREAVEKVVPLITPGKVHVVTDKYKDANEAMLAEGANYIYDTLMNAQLYRPDNVLLAHELQIDELLKTPEHTNYKVHFEGLNNYLKGLRKHELVVVGAGTGVGKSTFSKHLAYSLLTLHKDVRVGYIALEESIEKTLLSFIAIDNTVPLGDLYLDRTLIPQEAFKASYDKFKDRLFLYNHFGSLNPKNMLTQIQYLAKAMNVDFIFLDHLSILISGLDIDNERKAIDVFVTELRSFIENTGIGVVLVIHLNSNSHKKHEEGARVSIQDLRGSLSPAQTADAVIALERNIQHKDAHKRNETKVRVLKSRLFGNTGVASILEYRHGVLIEEQSFSPYNPYDDFEDDNEDF